MEGKKKERSGGLEKKKKRKENCEKMTCVEGGKEEERWLDINGPEREEKTLWSSNDGGKKREKMCKEV